MRPVGPDAVAALTAYLAETPDDPAHAGERKAAQKLLRTAELEVAALPETLAAELAELAGLLNRPVPSGDLQTLLAARRELRGVAVGVIEQLRAAEDREQLAALYAALGRHAEQRIPWQIVFTRPPAGPPASTREGP